MSLDTVRSKTPLWELFRDFLEPEPACWRVDEEKTNEYEEIAIKIAKSGKHGLDFLLSHLSSVDVPRIHAILVALSFLKPRIVHAEENRRGIKEQLLSMLEYGDPLVIANAIDRLRLLGFREESKRILRLREHSSPYVVGSVLRFLARHCPKTARPILEKALKSPEPIIRENGVDELDELGSVESLPKLRKLLSDPNANVREAAKWAVDHLERLQR